jgi:hypothetical protein
VSTCVRPLFVFFDVEPEAYMLQIHYLINLYLRIEVRKIRTMKLMHDIDTHTHTHTHTHILVGTFNTFIHKTFLIVSRIVLNISCCVLDRGAIILIRGYVQVYVRLTTLLIGEV